MDMVNNIEPLYNQKMAMFDEWVEQGDVWSEGDAGGEARALAEHFAEAIGEKYGRNDIEQAVSEMMEEFEEHRDYVIKKAVEQETHVPTPEELAMTPGDIEHAEKYEAVARRIGIDLLKTLIPASPERIRKALEKGDKHLNTIQLRKWDQASEAIPREQGKGLSLAEKVCALKHVAKWHYA
jgi:polyhydroxyalkanoate synthesis regulator phasin